MSYSDCTFVLRETLYAYIDDTSVFTADTAVADFLWLGNPDFLVSLYRLKSHFLAGIGKD